MSQFVEQESDEKEDCREDRGAPGQADIPVGPNLMKVCPPEKS
jgi:hypothetical protein